MGTPDSSQPKNAAAGVIAAIASEIPVVGAIVGSAAAILGARQRERDEEFWAMVVATGRLTEDRLRAIASGEDDEFVATAYRIVREARETASEEKRRMLADVLSRSGSWSAIPYDEREVLLPIVLELTPLHVMVLDYWSGPAAWLERNGIPIDTRVSSTSRLAAFQAHVAPDDPVRAGQLREVSEDLSRRGLLRGSFTGATSGNGTGQSLASDLGIRVLTYIVVPPREQP